MDSNKKPIDIEINELPEKSEASSEQSVENEMELKPSGEDELPVFDSLDMSDYEPEPVVDIDTDPLPIVSSSSAGDELPELEREEEEEETTETVVEEDEFIIDDYEVIEDAVFEIREILDLPENRIIATDEEQERDLREDLMRKLSEKELTPEKIHSINKTIKRFSKLKYDFSTMVNDEISDYKLKGVEHRRLLEKIQDGDFKDSILNPVVFGEKVLHATEGEDGPIVVEEDVENSRNIVAPPLVETIQTVIDVHEKYKKGPERLNYNLQKETRELLDLTPSINYGDPENGYKLSLKDRTRAVVNPNEETKVYVGDNQLEKRTFIDEILFPGINEIVSYNPFRIQGILRKEPRQEVLYRYAPLFQVLHNNEPMKFIDELPPRVVLNESFDIEDTINVCLPVQEEVVTIPGKIINITEDHYEIEPLRKTDKELYKTLKIAIKDEKLLITKNTLLQKQGDNDTCLVFEDTIFQFPDKPITSVEFETFLKQIIPSHKTIFYVNYPVLKSAQTLDEIERLLLQFGSDTNQLTQESMRIAKKFLDYNNKLQKDIYKTEYGAFRKNYKEPTPKYNKESDVSLLSKKKLSDFVKFYDEYPDFGKPNDSLITRLRWLLNRSDKGLLLYKTNAYNTIKRERLEDEYKLTNLKSQYDVSESKYQSSLKRVEKIKEKIINKKAGKCPERRIVKRYKTYEDMEYDTNKDIFIDNDLLLFNEKNTPLVKEGQFAVLEKPEGNEIWKRENIQGSMMWAKTDEIDGGHLVDSNLDFCNNQGKALETLDKINFEDPKRCVYSKALEVCVDKEDFRQLKEHHSNKEDLDSIKEQISFLGDSQNISIRLDKDIVELENKAYEYQKYVTKLTALREKETKEILDDPGKDELYRPIYQKIDAFKKEIHKLPEEQQYSKYQELIDKWGRPAMDSENPKNIYVKVGKKVLFCKHHELLIQKHNEKDNTAKAEIRNKLISEYGVPMNGYYVCINCGQQIAQEEFETVEGYTESGAFQTTTEVLEENQIEKSDKEIEKQVNYISVIESILSSTNKTDKVNTTTTADVLTIVREYQTLLGITFKEEKHIELIKQIHSDLKIESFKQWCNRPQIRKILNKKTRADLKKAYARFVNAESIMSITASFMLLCQTSNPIPLITKAHKSCQLTFMGYPLTDESNDKAEASFVCILENLRNSNSPLWKSLQKQKLKEKLRKQIDELLKKPIYKKRLSKKKEALAKETDDKVKITHAEWNEFRPPLKTLTVREATINKSRLNNNEKNYLYSLKTMEYIDSVIRNENATNTLFEPVPLGQSCCHQPLEPGFSVINYFDKDSSNLVTKNMNEIAPVKLHGENRKHPTLAFPFETKQELLTRFDKQIFAEGEEMSNVAIQEFFMRINTDELDPHFGEKLLFVDGVCIRSGKVKDDLLQKQYTLSDYENVIKKIHKKHLFSVPTNTDEPLPFIEVIQDVVKDNLMLAKRPEMKKLIKGLKSKKNTKELFDTLQVQTEVIIENIINSIPIEVFSNDKKKKLTEILLNLAQHSNTYTESLQTMNDEFAKTTQFTKGKQSLYNLISTFIPSIISLVKPQIPQEDFKGYLFEKLRYEQTSHSAANALFNYNCDISQKFKKSMNPSRYQNMIYEVIDLLKPYVNISQSISEHEFYEEKYIEDIVESVKKFKEPFERLSGYPVIYDIKKREVHEGQITSEQMFILCKYITIVFIYSLIQQDTSDIDNSLLLTSETTGEETMTEDGITESDMSVQTLENINIERVKFMADLFYKTLEMYSSQLDKLDYYTTKVIKQELAKDYDTKKNKTLKFYEDLDKESRKGLKLLLQVGLESYKKDLSETRNYLLENTQTSINDIGQEEYDNLAEPLDRPVITDEQRRIMDEGDVMPDDE